MTVIQKGAFDDCEKLSRVTFFGLNEPSQCDFSAFSGISTTTTFVRIQYKDETFCGMEVEHKLLPTIQSLGLSVGAIIAIVVSIFVIITAIVIIVILKMHKKNTSFGIELEDSTSEEQFNEATFE